MTHAKLWALFEKATDPIAASALAGRLLHAQQRMSRLTGSDMPERLILDGHLTPHAANDAATVEQLGQNLSGDELI